ncbi:molybdopterin-dependent oxidoreductase [Plastoroseomonas arctica]|uniref:Molybdopterin-dependent oxidoreductase n=1 Tax=Plastoroseomonas arctica TaxID=1509237 RepID=A0AAF1KU69_9PROT|nr:molybdopterin-dependent oxidoreductase [Plastoroseomonas arctica]MBR0655602.1 molybdopterin-dependent oxidoreductase [Plastoroseomonas arctica]
MRRIVLIGVLLLLALPAMAQEVVVRGIDGREVSVPAAEIAALPHVTVRGPGREAASYSGVPLVALLERVGAPFGQAMRGAALRVVVVVRASDGYAATLSLAEIDPGARGTQVILADRRAAEPLDAAEGPFRLVVEGDLRRARSVFRVNRIELVQLP